jgi:hypothetical protein
LINKDRIFVVGSAGEQPTALAYQKYPFSAFVPITPGTGIFVSKNTCDNAIAKNSQTAIIEIVIERLQSYG